MKLNNGIKAKLDEKKLEEIKEYCLSSLKRSTQALLDGDEKSIQDQFSEAFTASGGDWRFENKESLIKRVSSGDVKYKEISTDVERIDIPTENVAVLSGVRHVSAVVDGERFESKFQVKAVHLLEDGQWKALMWGVTC